MIEVFELCAYGSLQRPTTDASLTGGGIDVGTRVEFADLDVNDFVQVVGESLTDVTQVRVTGRLASGMIESETLTTSGRTPVQSVNVYERLMKIEKLDTAPLPIAVERKTAALTGAATGGGVSEITLPVSASSADGAYAGMLIRLTSGTGAGQIARILSYIGSTRTASIDARWSTPPTNATGFRISSGALLRSVVTRVVRPFWNVIADLRGGVERRFYEKIFLRNVSDENLDDSFVAESYNPLGVIHFSLDAALDDTSSSANRRTAPSGLVFNRIPKQVPGLRITPLSAIGVWLEFRLPAGQPPVKTSYGISLAGTTT